MMDASRLAVLLRALEPRLHAGRYVFATLGPGGRVPPEEMLASVREDEGLTVVVAEEVARREGLAIAFTAEWITLTVASDLADVGLTAAFAKAMAEAGIGCNVVAGVHHDHLFVPAGRGEAAMAALQGLQSRGAI